MKPPAKNSKPLLGLFLLAGLSGLAIAAEPSALETVPKGLAKSDWHSIRAAYEAGRHAIHRQENGTLTARNPGQQWRTEFDGKGFLTTPDHGQWTWGLELTGYGERTLPSAPSAISHEGGKISCQRDAYLTEWFINDTRGLEQGWTIQSKPTSTHENLTLTLTLRGDLKPLVSPDSSSVAFQTSSGGTALTYGGLKAWDADGKTLIVRFEPAGETAIRIAVDDQNARYPITIDPIAQQAYLKASNSDLSDLFGVSVAVWGETVVVGASHEDSSTTGINSIPDNAAANAGAVYVFVRNGGLWSQQAYLKASNTGAGDFFGGFVAISEDTIVVGAIYESSSTTGVNGPSNEAASFSGAAYVFTRTGTAWSQQAYLKASNTDAGDRFGWSVAVSGDTLVVGAESESSSTTGVNGPSNEAASFSGAAYVFQRSGASWSQQAFLKASNTGGNDRFGYAVAVFGDTVVVGAGGEDSSTTGVNGPSNEAAPDSGAVYAFVRSGAAWTQQAFLKASNTGASDHFGEAVAISGDRVVVGAPDEDSGTTGVNSIPDESAPDSGAAYVFLRGGAVWSQQAYLKASNTGAGDEFGESVAVSGGSLVVGASDEDSSTKMVNGTPDEAAPDAGAAYFFVSSGPTWIQQAFLKPRNTDAADLFGRSVAVSGEIVVVGAYGEDSSTTGVNSSPNEDASGAGAAYIFYPSCGFSVHEPKVVINRAGLDVPYGSTQLFSPIVLGSITEVQYLLVNPGDIDLLMPGTPRVGLTGSSDFAVITQPSSPVAANGGSTSFTVRFTPTSTNVQTAQLSIPNNAGDQTPFIINLAATYSDTLDSDGDGMSDAAEFKLICLGFDWQVSQPALVASFLANSGLYTLPQVQAINVGTPLLTKNPGTGQFKLTLGLEKSTNLNNFTPFPFTTPKTTVNGEGKIEFLFSSPDNAAFFQLRAE